VDVQLAKWRHHWVRCVTLLLHHCNGCNQIQSPNWSAAHCSLLTESRTATATVTVTVAVTVPLVRPLTFISLISSHPCPCCIPHNPLSITSSPWILPITDSTPRSPCLSTLQSQILPIHLIQRISWAYPNLGRSCREHHIDSQQSSRDGEQSMCLW